MSDNVTPWVSASDANGTCVELRRNGEKIELRDSKHPDGNILDDFTPAELTAFLNGAKSGRFDHLL